MTLEWKSISSTITIQLCFLKQRQYDLLSWNQKAAMDEKEFRWARKKNHTPVLGQKIICIKQIPSLHIVLHFTEMLWLHGWEKRDRKGKRKRNHINPLITVVSVREKKNFFQHYLRAQNHTQKKAFHSFAQLLFPPLEMSFLSTMVKSILYSLVQDPLV